MCVDTSFICFSFFFILIVLRCACIVFGIWNRRSGRKYSSNYYYYSCVLFLSSRSCFINCLMKLLFLSFLFIQQLNILQWRDCIRATGIIEIPHFLSHVNWKRMKNWMFANIFIIPLDRVHCSVLHCIANQRNI